MDNGGDILQLCRLCLVKDDVNIPIFEGQGDIRQIFLKISSCLPVKVSREDKLPKKICDGCSYKLDMLYEFWNTTANAEKQLLSWLGEAGMNSKMTDGTISAVAQQIKPTETFVKQEAIDPSDIHAEDNDDDKSYMFQQKFTVEEAGPSATVTSNDEEPPPKRARRTAAVKAQIAMDPESDDDDDSGEPMTKVEDESDDSDGDDHEPNYVDVPSTSADDQPGPSGVGKDGVEAPWDGVEEIADAEHTNIQCGMCSELFPSKDKFIEHTMKLFGEQFVCCKCHLKFDHNVELYEHYQTHRLGDESMVVEDGIVEEEVEEMVLNYGENEEVIVQQPATSETNELLYILDDSQCVNEVVIEQDQNIIETTERTERETVEIVNLEHGYVMSNMEDIIEEEDAEGNIIFTRRVSVPVKPSTSKRLYTQPKPRTPQPKRRHEVPDFSATNYAFINANEEVDVPHYKCLRCEQLFINKFVFFRHIEKGKCYINNCDVCTATFTKNSEFYDHYIAEHTDRAICNFCFRTFMYEKNVKEHMLRHLDQFRHRCEDCNKGFYTVREYRNHYKNRHMGIRHKCEVCGRSFADEYYFKRHIATHAKASNITVLQITN